MVRGLAHWFGIVGLGPTPFSNPYTLLARMGAASEQGRRDCDNSSGWVEFPVRPVGPLKLALSTAHDDAVRRNEMDRRFCHDTKIGATTTWTRAPLAGGPSEDAFNGCGVSLELRDRNLA
jgi:hypothetical protein